MLVSAYGIEAEELSLYRRRSAMSWIDDAAMGNVYCQSRFVNQTIQCFLEFFMDNKCSEVQTRHLQIACSRRVFGLPDGLATDENC